MSEKDFRIGVICFSVVLCVTIISFVTLWAVMFTTKVSFEFDCSYSDLQKLPEGVSLFPHVDKDLNGPYEFKVVPDDFRCKAKGSIPLAVLGG